MVNIQKFNIRKNYFKLLFLLKHFFNLFFLICFMINVSNSISFFSTPSVCEGLYSLTNVMTFLNIVQYLLALYLLINEVSIVISLLSFTSTTTFNCAILHSEVKVV